MTVRTVEKSIRQAALDLARFNVESEPEILKIYLFPDEKEIRFVVVDPTTLPSKSVSPFYFAAAPGEGLPYKSAVALILPDEEKRLPTPEGWDWSDAEIIWSRD